MVDVPVSAQARRTTLTLLGPLGGFETGLDGGWEFVTPSLLDLLGGLPASSLLGREWINRIHPEDVQRALAEYRQAREFHRPWTQQLRMLGADSVPVWLSFNAYPLPSHSESRGVVLIGVIKDITAEMRAQQLAKQSEQMVSELTEFYSQALFILRDDYIIEANAASTRILDCTRDDLIGRTAQSIIWPGDEERFARPANAPELFMTGRVRRIGDGQPVLIASHGRPITYAGAPARVVSFVPVDDPHIQAALEDRNLRRLQSLESLLPLAYHRVSLEGDDVGVIEYANARFAELLGRTPEELIGTSMIDLTHVDERAAAIANMQDFRVRDGRQPAFVRRFERPDGSTLALEVNSSIYRDPVTGHSVSMSLSKPVNPEDPEAAGITSH